MRIERIYRYLLPCGHTYCSTTRSQCDQCWSPDEDDGNEELPVHYFPCRPCLVSYGIPHGEMGDCECPPLRIDGRRLGDIKVAELVDDEVRRQRVLRMLWLGLLTYQQIAAHCGVGLRTVERAAVALKMKDN